MTLKSEEFNGQKGSSTPYRSPILVEAGHARPILDVTFSGDGKVLATLDNDGRVCFWDTFTGKFLDSILENGLYSAVSVELSQTGRYVIINWNYLSILIDRATGKRISSIPALRGGAQLTRFAVSKDETKVLISEERQPLKLVSLETEKTLVEKISNGTVVDMWSSNDAFTTVNGSGHIVVLDASSLRVQEEILAESKIYARFDSCHAANAAFYAVQDAMGFHCIDFGQAEPTYFSHKGYSYSIGLSVSPNGSMIACHFNKEVQIVESQTGKVIRTLMLGWGDIKDLEWHPNGDLIAVLRSGGELSIINATSGLKVVGLDTSVFLAGGARVGISSGNSILGVAGQDGRYRVVALKSPFSVKVSEEYSPFSDWCESTGFLSPYFVANKGFEASIVLDQNAKIIAQLPPCLAFTKQLVVSDRKKVTLYNLTEGGGTPLSSFNSLGIVKVSHNLNLALRKVKRNEWELLQAPNWEGVLKIANLPEGVSKILALNRNAILFTDKYDIVNRYNISGGTVEKLYEDPQRRSWTEAFQPDLVSPIFLNSAITGEPSVVIESKSGRVLYSTRDWDSGNQVRKDFCSFSKDGRYYWSVAEDARPVLHDLKSGEPLLQMTIWLDGGVLFQTRSGLFHGNDRGIGKVLTRTGSKKKLTDFHDSKTIENLLDLTR